MPSPCADMLCICPSGEAGAQPLLPSLFPHQGEKVTTSSVTSQCASARDRGAGPRIFLPSALYWLPWQGHMNCGGAGRGGVVQAARC